MTLLSKIFPLLSDAEQETFNARLAKCFDFRMDKIKDMATNLLAQKQVAISK